MSKLLNVIKTEPVMITGLVQAILALVVGLGFALTAGQTGALEAATSAVLALVAAVSVRPFPVAALTGAFTAVATALVAFGVPHVTTGEVSLLNTVVVAVLALALRGHVTPTATLRKAAAAVPIPTAA